jgi:hypothetical protein
MTGWIHEIPTWVSAIVLLALFVGIAIFGLSSTRGWMRRRGVHALIDNNVVGWMFSAMLAIYAITIGLTAVACWSNSVAASNVASLEAAQIAAVYRDVDGYPEPVRSELQSRLRDYLQDVVDAAWPAHRRGLVSHSGTLKLDDFQRVLYAFEPTTEGQKIVHAEALDAFNRVVETRRQRLEAVGREIPGTLWSVVLIGAALAISASWVFTLESIELHAVMSGLLAAMIGLLVFFIAVTDRPFHGANGIAPDAYRLVLRDLLDGAEP